MKATSLGLALVAFLTVFALNFSRVTTKSGKTDLSLSAMKAKAQTGENCDYGANGSWMQSGPGTTYTNPYGEICTVAMYTFYCYSSGPFVCEASCYKTEQFTFC